MCYYPNAIESANDTDSAVANVEVIVGAIAPVTSVENVAVAD